MKCDNKIVKHISKPQLTQDRSSYVIGSPLSLTKATANHITGSRLTFGQYTVNILEHFIISGIHILYVYNSY